jgi:hypothetical protein
MILTNTTKCVIDMSPLAVLNFLHLILLRMVKQETTLVGLKLADSNTSLQKQSVFNMHLHNF